MREYIIEQMNKGVSLEDIHIAVEQMFNEEYNKREEMKAHLTNVALDRAAKATAEYFNTVTGLTEFDAEEFKVMLQDLVTQAQIITKARVKMDESTKAENVADALAAARGVANPRVEVTYNGVKDEEEADRALMQFLFDLGLIKHVE